MTEEEKFLPRIRDLFLVVAGTFLLLLIVELIGRGSTNKWKLLLIESITILPVLIYVLIKKHSFRETFRWKKVDGHVLLISVVIGLGLSVIIDELDTLIQMLIPMPEEIFQTMKEILLFDSNGELVLLILATVVVAGFTEEMLFRGFVQGSLEKKTDVTKAVLATAFIFAFVHFNPWWFIEILIIGVFLGVLVWRSGSVFPAVVVHAVNNGLALFLINAEPSDLDWYRMKGHVSPIWLILGLGCIVFGFRVFYGLTEAYFIQASDARR